MTGMLSFPITALGKNRFNTLCQVIVTAFIQLSAQRIATFQN